MDCHIYTYPCVLPCVLPYVALHPLLLIFQSPYYLPSVSMLNVVYSMLANETRYMWLCMQVCTGRLLAVVCQHYQPVNVLRVTDDGTYLISGGADARVIVWRLGRYVLSWMLYYL